MTSLRQVENASSMRNDEGREKVNLLSVLPAVSIWLAAVGIGYWWTADVHLCMGMQLCDYCVASCSGYRLLVDC